MPRLSAALWPDEPKSGASTRLFRTGAMAPCKSAQPVGGWVLDVTMPPMPQVRAIAADAPTRPSGHVKGTRTDPQKFAVHTGPSRIDGTGAFAAEAIPARRKIGEIRGESISVREARRRAKGAKPIGMSGPMPSPMAPRRITGFLCLAALPGPGMAKG